MMNMLIDDINKRLGVNAVYCGTDVILCDNKKQIVYSHYTTAKTNTKTTNNSIKDHINNKYGIIKNQKGVSQ